MKELLIRAKIDEIEDELVRRAEQVVQKCRGITGKLEDKQLRNVEAVAAETESVAVVDNFIKYQIGRAKEGEGWRFGPDQGFGEAVRQDLEWLKEQAGGKAGGGVTAKDLEIRLVRRYLGYLTRYFKYAQVQPTGGGN